MYDDFDDDPTFEGQSGVDGDALRRAERRAGRSGESRRPSSARKEGSQPPRGRQKRSRLLAVIVLVAVAIVLVIALVAASGGASDPQTGDTVPVSLVPVTPDFQQEEGGTTGSSTSETSTSETSTSSTSTTISFSPVSSSTPVALTTPAAAAAPVAGDGA